MAIGEARRTAEWLRKHGVADRRSRMVRCITCGGYAISSEQIAEVVGVGVGSVRKWLNRQPVRPDIAEKLRSAFLRVEE